jgi:hypothetical protein
MAAGGSDRRGNPLQAADVIFVVLVLAVIFCVHCSKICAVTNEL